MSYLVLARKYRPQIFDEVIGQEHITSILKQAVQSDKIAHAYLFCGPRGIGKTSCARILAKSLNCAKGPTVQPCGKCPACEEITKGNSFDVLEIDGASNRGIDEIRTLRENVKFAPSYGRYKIYIIDEVHMLTQEAFNALLKTLEEPPPHAKFIFATTAPHKVPSTIISRCQRFDFKRIALKEIVEILSEISKKEKYRIDQDGAYAIAKAAQGNLRDALSILDQISALSDQGIKAESVWTMLGLVETQLLFDLSDALGQKDCPRALQILEQIVEKGKDIKQLVRDTLDHFRNLMVIKVGGKSLGKLIDHPVAIKEMLLKQCELFTLKEILAAIDMFIEAQETARITESLRMPLEVAFAKLTYTGEKPAIQAQEGVARETAKQPSRAVLGNKKGQLDMTGSHAPKKPTPEDASSKEETDVDEMEVQEDGPVRELGAREAQDLEFVDLEKIKKAWDALTYAVSREKMSVATYLQSGFPVEFEHNKLTIGFPKGCSFQKETLEGQNNVEVVERIFSGQLKNRILVRYKMVEHYVQQEEEGLVKKALDTFSGKVVSRWHNV